MKPYKQPKRGLFGRKPEPEPEPPQDTKLDELIQVLKNIQYNIGLIAEVKVVEHNERVKDDQDDLPELEEETVTLTKSEIQDMIREAMKDKKK